MLSTGNARDNDGLDALATALWPPGTTSDCLRSIPRPNRKCSAPAFRKTRGLGRRAYPRAFTTACTDSPPAGPRSRRGSGDTLDCPSRSHILRGIRPQGSSGRVRRRLASEIMGDVRTLEQKIANLKTSRSLCRGRSLRSTSLTEIFGIGVPYTGRQDHRDSRQRSAFPYQGTLLRLLLWHGAVVEASSGEVIRHRLSLAGNRHLNTALCTWWRCARG
jgi:hypothetical protein